MNELSAGNRISYNKNILLNLCNETNSAESLEYLLSNFSGQVVTGISEILESNEFICVYAIGDIKQIKPSKHAILIIKELSFNYDNLAGSLYRLVELGEVPINIHGVGVYYRHLFTGDDCFGQIKSEHHFQNLTESNKPSKALRKGIYLTNIVKKLSGNKEELHFRLLRCSSNLTGATDNFRKADHSIVDLLNHVAQFDFENHTQLNHVLAQIYENKSKGEGNPKDVKAKIKAHSDKTKDMPKNALIAFCTFYDKTHFENLTVSKVDRFDWCYKKSSALTRLHFKLKKTVDDDSLKKEFSVTLYPNSAFLIPLSTNRLYTHEIRPSVLNIDKIPTRLGYVVRSSNLEAIYTEKGVFIKEGDELIKLEDMTKETMHDLRDSYYKENRTESIVNYGNILFSMNSGDYKKPIF
ncbi:hypothetical protein [Pseudoalteromonas sp. TB64]|uniref:hypothetical protein n=1 Tax=Pseudoalteromonas sp. TB64 TaxID=1938600 RepID=UPI0004218AD3|nr:hypothetical protein [Pseudoalteromonas sp. TB64]